MTGRGRRGARCALVAVLGALVAVAASSALPSLAASRLPSASKVVYVDVGQGDGVAIKIDGKIIVSDAGEAFAAPRMRAALDRLGARRIDIAILSHSHDDHIGGFLALLKEFPIRRVIAAPNDHYQRTKTNRALIQALNTRHIPIDWVAAGEVRHFGGASWRILSPPADTYTDNADAANASVVYLLTTHAHRLLFTGDIEESVAERIAQAWHFGRVDIFLATHHGSKHGSTAMLLAKIRPRFAVLSTGPNRFGHPAPEAIARLHAVGATIWCTDTNGDLEATLTAGREVVWRVSKQQSPWWSTTRGQTGRCVRS